MNILLACNNSSVLNTILFIKKLIDIIFIVAPIVLVLLLTIDIAKNVISKDDSENKRNINIAIKRVVYCLILFFVPLIIDGVMSYLDNYNVNFAKCYSDATEENVQKYYDEENKRYEEEQKRREEERRSNFNKVNEETNKEAEDTKKAVSSAAKKIAEVVAERAKEAISNNYTYSSCQISEASSGGLQTVSFKNGLKRWKWEYVFRFKDPAKAELAARCMENGVANNKHIKYCGPYDQLYYDSKKYGFDVSKVKKKSCTTCSPYVSVCINYAGISMPPGLNAASPTQPINYFKKRSKHFEIIHDEKVAQNCMQLRRGDILFKNKYNGMGHMVMAT